MSDEMMRMLMDDELGAQPETGEMEVFMERGDERKRREREREREMEAKRRKPAAGSRDRAGRQERGMISR